MLFFDYNGSGLREDTEPPIAGFGVCATVMGQEEVCTHTDEDGRYVFESLAQAGTQAHLSFVDPNADDPALAFRYVNLWNGPVVIPAYEMSGVQVPDQRLNDTEIVPIARGIDTRTGENDEVGLMQGFLTLPFRCEDIHQIEWISHFDHDPRPGSVMNWYGNTNVWTDDDPGFGTWDGHSGTDFGVSSGTYLVASAPAILAHEFVNPDNGARVASGLSILNLCVIPPGEDTLPWRCSNEQALHCSPER